MTKRLLIAMFIAITVFQIQAQRMLDVSNGSISSTLSNAKVERTIVPIENGYRVSYYFDKVALIPDNLFPDCELWHIDGFTVNNTPEEPAYPYASDSFSIPSGHTAHVNVKREDWITIPSIPSPARQPLLISDSIGYNINNVLPIKNIGNEWIPSKSISDNGIKYYKGVGILNIGITPVQFNVSKGEARICKILEYEISFSSELTFLKSERSNSDDISYFEDSYLSATTLNWQWEKNQCGVEEKEKSIDLFDTTGFPTHSTMSDIPNLIHGIPAIVPNYLIIAATPYINAVEEFARWKRTLGLNVTTAYKDVWTKDEILDVIYDQDDLSYLLFVGNNTQIPGDIIAYKPGGEERKTLTDISYACQDMDAIIPDFSYGRLPVNNLQEATRVLNRIQDYEKSPSNTSSFYNSNLFISRFLGNATTENKRNSQTTYDISEYMKSHGRSVCNMMTAHPQQNPLYWTDCGKDENGSFVTPAPIPFNMRKPQYGWDATSNDIISEINKGYSQVFYFSHGKVNAWSDLSISSNDIANLSNGNQLPVIFSMACHTGNFSTRGSLAEEFITAPSGGAIAVFGFTKGTFVAYTDIIGYSLYNMMYPNPGLSPGISDRLDGCSLILQLGNDQITELGLLHRTAITKMVNSIPMTSTSEQYKKYEAGMFTLFGDPSMNIPISKPKKITASPIMSSTGQFTLSCNENATITLYNGKTNQVRNFKTRVTFTPPTDASQFVVCIHAPGEIPYIMDFSVSNTINRVARDASNEGKIVKEGKTWRYHSTLNCNMDPDEDIYLDVCFLGHTEIEGKEYLNCYVWKTDDEFSEETAALIGYMREDEDGKVYVRYIPDAHITAMKKGLDILPYAPMMAIYNHDLDVLSKVDVLLFDPTLEIGENLYSVSEGSSYDVFTVFDIIDTTTLGISRKMWIMSSGTHGEAGYDFLEEIGSLYGLLPFPGTSPISFDTDTWTLYEVFDDEENVLFLHSDMKMDVENIFDDANVISEIIHDLHGIEIKRPTQSGIYLKTQVLENGYTRTQKIYVK